MKFRLSYIPAILLCFCTAAAAQEFTPVVTHFNKKDYLADNQNWAVAQGADGVMYFGNGSCLLSYDGILWERDYLPHGKIVRSLFSDGGRIYVGSYEEFGYFEKEPEGKLLYSSLSDRLDGYEMQNDEIWTILKVGERVVFQAFASYFVYDAASGGLEAFRSSDIFMFFCPYKDRIFSTVNTDRLAEIGIEDGKVSLIANVPFRSQLIDVLPYKDDKILMVTYSDGIFVYDTEEGTFVPFRTEADGMLGHSQVNKAARSADGNIVIGTILNGAVAITPEGKVAWSINSSNVLGSDIVLGMDFDRDGNLWLALDSGIALVPDARALMYVNKLFPSVGSVYTVCPLGNFLFLGTSQGLYKAVVQKGKKAVTGIVMESKVKGNVWHIDTFGSQTFCGTNSATYELVPTGGGYSPELACPVEGGMCMAEGYVNGQHILIQGTYTYLCVYIMRSGRWEYSHAIEGFMEPVSSVYIDYTGAIWAGHLHKGLYLLRLSHDLGSVSSVVEYESFGGVPSFSVKVHELNGRAVFNNGNGFHTYDDIRRNMVECTDLNEALGAFSKSYRICRAEYDSYWFITPYEAALVRFSGSSIRVEDIVSYNSFASNTVDWRQNIVRINEDMSVFTLENSIAVYSAGKSVVDEPSFSLFLDRAETDGDMADFVVRCPLYNPVGGVAFRYSLTRNGDLFKEEISSSPRIGYVNLRDGNYTLEVSAFTKGGNVMGEISYAFIIEPPFYRSAFALGLYSVLLLAVAVSFAVYRVYRYRTARLGKELKVADGGELSLITKSVLEGDDRFLHKLKSRYPELTPTDLRFCACLRMNLSSKEIASIMNISLKGVEAARYRIRKKIGLASDVNLAEYIIDFQ